jgi:hypothetical protein
VLRTLSSSRLFGVQNITAATAQPWNTLISDWALALWADDAPELAGVNVNPRYRYNSINLRHTIINSGSFSLRPQVLPVNGFLAAGMLEASSLRFFLLGGTAPSPVHLTFSGKWGGQFAASAGPQLTVMRVR